MQRAQAEGWELTAAEQICRQESLEQAAADLQRRLREVEEREARVEAFLAGLLQPCQRPTPNPSATRLM